MGTLSYEQRVERLSWVRGVDTKTRADHLLCLARVPSLLVRVEQLEACLREVRSFSQCHHGDEDSAMWLHALLVDIPHRIDEVLP